MISVAVVVSAFTVKLIVGESALDPIAVGIEEYAFSLHDIILPGACKAISAVPLLGSLSMLLTGFPIAFVAVTTGPVKMPWPSMTRRNH